MKHIEKGWAIESIFSDLYLGWSMTRIGAIANHVHDRGDKFERPSRFAFGNLNDVQRKIWLQCKKRGDRAVKVTLTWSSARRDKQAITGR